MCTRQELSEDLKSLMQTQLFENVTARQEVVKGTRGKRRILVTFQQRIWPPLKSFRVQDGSGRSSLLAVPNDVVARVMEEYKKMGNKPTDMGVLALMRNTIEGWYSDRGYGMAYVTTFDGLDSGNVVANVVEGKVTRVNLVPVDDNGNATDKSGLNLDFVRRELRDIIKTGDLYSVEDSRKALKELMQSGLFENMQVLPRQSPTDETKGTCMHACGHVTIQFFLSSIHPSIHASIHPQPPTPSLLPSTPSPDPDINSRAGRHGQGAPRAHRRGRVRVGIRP